MQQSTRPIILEIAVLLIALAAGLYWIHVSSLPPAQDQVAATPVSPDDSAPSPPPATSSDPLLLALGNIKGAVFDPVRGRLVVVAPLDATGPAVTPHDWGIALKCAASSESPTFSLDPAEPTNPRGPTLSCVYYGPISGTHLGQVMFDADWLMKQMGLGNVRPAVEGFQDIFELTFARGVNRNSTSTFMRFWITCVDLAVRASEHALVFDGIRLGVKTEKMHESSSGLTSSGGQEDPVAKQFAQFLTDHFDEIAATQPAFAELKRLSGLLALATWLRNQGGEVDPTWLSENSVAALATPVTEQNKSLTREKREVKTRQVRGGTETETITRSVTLFGGVDLALTLPEPSRDREAQRLYNFVTKKAEWNGERLPQKASATAVTAPMVRPQFNKRAQLPWRRVKPPC